MIGFIDNFKILISGIMIYILIYAALIKIEVFGSKNINTLVALISAVIVSFTGVITYVISYAINWFIILFFIIFLIFILLMFIGIDVKEISNLAISNKKIIIISFLVLFSIIFIKGFFALNNTFDSNEPINNSYNVDTSFNTGVDDITNSEVDKSFWNSFSLNSDITSAAIFLGILGVFIMMIG